MTGYSSSPAAAPSREELRWLALGMYFRSYQAYEVERVLVGRGAAGASRPLRWIAVIHTVVTALLVLILSRPLVDGDPMAQQIVAAHALICVASWALWSWSFSAPLPAAIVGLLLLVSMAMADDAMRIDSDAAQCRSVLSGVVPLTTIGLLIRAIYSGWRFRVIELDLEPDAQLEVELTADSVRPRSRGILSPICLYLVLLSIVVIPLSLAVNLDLTIADLLDVHKLMAIVVLAWAIACWRDTLPVLRNFATPNWYVTAFVFGLGTFALASLYGDALAYSSHVQQAKLSAGFLKEGYSWWTVLGIVAVFPAVFEELAFRGIIVPQLGRVLNSEETIAVSAMMFMILHLSVLSAPHLLLLGALTAYIRLRSKSIWPCMLLHFTHNAMCIGFEKWM